MAGNDNFSTGGQLRPLPGGYPPPPPGGYAAPPSGRYPPPGQPNPQPPPPKKRSLGRKILGVLVTIALVIAVRVGIHAALDRHHDSPLDNGFDYAIGTCLNLSKTTSFVKPSDVQVEPCSSPAALAKVAKKYKGTKNCPNDEYATLEGGGSGLCLQDNLTVGSCYRQKMLSHMFESSACSPGLSNTPTFKVAQRRDGVDDPGLCDGEQQAVHFPEPPLTYCMDVLVIQLPGGHNP